MHLGPSAEESEQGSCVTHSWTQLGCSMFSPGLKNLLLLSQADVDCDVWCPVTILGAEVIHSALRYKPYPQTCFRAVPALRELRAGLFPLFR